MVLDLMATVVPWTPNHYMLLLSFLVTLLNLAVRPLRIEHQRNQAGTILVVSFQLASFHSAAQAANMLLKESNHTQLNSLSHNNDWPGKIYLLVQ